MRCSEGNAVRHTGYEKMSTMSIVVVVVVLGMGSKDEAFNGHVSSVAL